MLHTPSYNLGLAAGIAAKALGQTRPESYDAIPGLDRTLDAMEGNFMFPSSYVEGYVAAFDPSGRNFIPDHDDPVREAARTETDRLRKLA